MQLLTSIHMIFDKGAKEYTLEERDHLQRILLAKLYLRQEMNEITALSDTLHKSQASVT